MKLIKKCVALIIILGVLTMTLSCKEDDTVDESILAKPTNPVVKMDTSLGDIFIELYEKEAPVTVENFLTYVKDGFYEGTIFHRVIKGFMIQGGGMLSDMSEKPNRDPIKNEAFNGVKNERGTLAMARTAVVDSATSQFFINVADNSFLDHKSNNPVEYGYAVFGKVVEGMDVVDQIQNTATHARQPYEDVPQSDIVINKVVVVH